MAALGLLFLAGCVVLAGLTVASSPDDAGRVIPFLGILFATVGLAIPLVAWWRQRTTLTSPTADQLDRARETLAGIVAQQWRQEALARSLGDPEPMPVCWKLTEPAGRGDPRRIAEELPFTGRSDRIGSLAAQFRRLKRRRLVILGGPGSGKTTLAVQLLLELLATRQPGEPVPVLVSLAGWDPTDQPLLHTWLAARLAEAYPLLRAFHPTTAQALAEQGHLLPILDGLDELPEPHQPEVVDALNKSLTDTDQLVLTSRTTEYTKAITARKALTSAAVIAPEPLTTTQAAEYLTDCLPPDPDPDWRKFLHRLRTGAAEHLAPVLSTPLGLWLLRTVYVAPRADPTPLLTRDTAPVQADLFDQLIPAVLATRPAACHGGDTSRPRHTWHPQDVRNWLTYLAQHLDDHIGTRNLRWWQLARHTVTCRAFRTAAGLVVGLTFGVVTWLAFGLRWGLVVGLMSGLAFGLTFGLMFGLLFEPTVRRWLTDDPAYANLQLKQRVTLLARQLAVGLTVGLAVGLVSGLALGLVGGLTVELEGGVAAGLKHGLVGGLTLGSVGGLMVGLITWVGIPTRTDRVTGPQTTYQATRALTVLQLGLALLLAVLMTWLAGGVAADLAAELTVGLTEGLAVGMTAGTAIGLAVGLAARRAGKLIIRSGAWLSYLLAIGQLAAARKLPLRLMGFLDDAHRLGLLRTVGPVYQFRHAEFQDHLVRTAVRAGPGSEHPR